MATEAELRYTDEFGRFFARRYGLPPATGRVLGWLLICEPPDQTAAEIAEALHISRSGAGAAITTLEGFHLIRRRRAPGERADRIAVNPEAAEAGLDVAEYVEMSALAAAGLEMLEGEPLERRARLLGAKALNDFLVERLPQLTEEWRQRARELRESGELPPV